MALFPAWADVLTEWGLLKALLDKEKLWLSHLQMFEAQPGAGSAPNAPKPANHFGQTSGGQEIQAGTALPTYD